MCARRGGGRRLSGKPRPVHAGCARRSVRVSVLRLRSAHRLRRFHALDGSGQALRPSAGRRPLGLLTGYRRQSEELSRACEQRLADGLGFASQVRVLERVAELVARLVVVPYVRTTGCPSTRRRSMASIGFDGCGQAVGRRRGWLEQRGVRCVAAIGGCCPGFRGRFTRWVLVSWACFTRWVPGGGLLVRAGAGGRPGAASANRALLGGFTSCSGPGRSLFLLPRLKSLYSASLPRWASGCVQRCRWILATVSKTAPHRVRSGRVLLGGLGPDRRAARCGRPSGVPLGGPGPLLGRADGASARIFDGCAPPCARSPALYRRAAVCAS